MAARNKYKIDNSQEYVNEETSVKNKDDNNVLITSVKSQNNYDVTKQTTFTDDALHVTDSVDATGEMEVNEAQKRRNKRRTQKPLLYCRIIVKHPYISFGVTLSLHLIFLGVNIILATTGYDILPFDFNRIPMNLREDTVRLRDWAWLYKDSDGKRINRFTLNMTGMWPRGQIGDMMHVMYDKDGANVFTRDTFKQMQRIEERIYNLTEYQSTFCQLDGNLYLTPHVRCHPLWSVLRYFDGSLRHISPVFHDPDFTNISSVLLEAHDNPETADDFQFFLGKNSEISPSRIHNELTRTGIQIGTPLPDGGDFTQRAGDWFIAVVAPMLNEDRRTLRGTLNICYISHTLVTRIAPDIALGDLKLAMLSVTFIFFFMWYQTGSLWITFFAIASIGTCLAITNLIYYCVYQYRYLGYFHLLSVFIIFGIGADDIFVFFNTWRLTGFTEYPSLAHRLSDCYRRAAGSMFITSLTTSAAFLVTGLSPMLAIYSFGVFTGTLVLVNYLSVIIYFPTVVIVYHLIFEDLWTDCCEYNSCNVKCKSMCKPKCCNTSPTCCNISPTCCTNSTCAGGSDCTETCEDQQLDTPGKLGPATKAWGVRFFEGPFYHLVTHKLARWVIIVVCAVTMGFFIWSATTLKPDAEPVQIMKTSTIIGKAWVQFFTGFRPTSQSRINLVIAWGLQEQDLSSCHFSKDGCRGRTVWDEKFDLNSPQVQLALKDFCNHLKYGLSDDKAGSLRIRNDSITGQRHIHCFTEDMEDFFRAEEEYLESVTNSTWDLSLPLTENKVTRLAQFYDPAIYDVNSMSVSFHSFFEIALGFWLSDGFSMFVTDDFIKYNNILGETNDTHARQINGLYFPQLNMGPYYGTKLRYAAISVNLSLDFYGLGYVEGLPVYYEWENTMSEMMSKMPYQLQGGFQTNINMWHWLFVQKTAVENAEQGITLGIVLALVVLLVATGNFIIGLFATFIIAMATTCVIGIIPLFGWKLGILVSINLCLVVGLSVDYIVHLAEAYHKSVEVKRKDRIRDALGSVGMAVISGAMTTTGAAFFMCFGRIEFLLQFAVFIFATVGFSLLFSLFFFSAVMGICGPEGHTGSMKHLYKVARNKVTGRKGNDVKCETCNGKGFHHNKAEEEAQNTENPSNIMEGTFYSNNVTSSNYSLNRGSQTFLIPPDCETTKL